MIIKGGARAGGADLAAHLQRLDTNERMDVLELRDVAGVNLDQALRELEAHGSAIRCKAALYQASINPRADEVLSPGQWVRAVERLEQELGLTGQPRVVVAHVKEGRAHVHAVWSRIDLERLKAIPDSWNYAKHESVARDLEREFGLSRIQGAHAERGGAARPGRTPSAAEMSQSARSGIDPKTRKAELTALWQAADSGAAFVAAAQAAGYQLARGDARAYVVVDAAGEVYALARQLAGVRTAEVKARLAGIPPAALPGVEQARALQAARAEARKDAPPPMNEPEGLSLEDQWRAEVLRLETERVAQWKQEQAQLAESQKSAADRAEAIRQDDARKAEQIAGDAQQKRDEVARLAGLERDAQAAELAKLEAVKLEQLRDQQERAAAYLAEQERQADQSRRTEAARAQGDSGRAREGAIRNASDRYLQALGRHYDVANPYSSLARTAMAEAGAFSRDQEELRQQAAAENDPAKRELLDLRRDIEAKEHFAQAGNRVSRLNAALTGQPEQQWKEFAANHAAEAVQLREQYRALAAEQDKAREADRAAPARQEPSPQPGQPEQGAKLAPAPEATGKPAPEVQQAAKAQAAQERQAQRDQEIRSMQAREHEQQREALEKRRASDAERKALEERQRQERERLAAQQRKREIERQQAQENTREH
jgi:hypothetical protein